MGQSLSITICKECAKKSTFALFLDQLSAKVSVTAILRHPLFGDCFFEAIRRFEFVLPGVGWRVIPRAMERSPGRPHAPATPSIQHAGCCVQMNF